MNNVNPSSIIKKPGPKLTRPSSQKASSDFVADKSCEVFVGDAAVNLRRRRSSSNSASFAHQVAGHGLMLSGLDQGTILKPLIPQEFMFYTSLVNSRDPLLPFVPKLIGAVEADSADPLPSKLRKIQSTKTDYPIKTNWTGGCGWPGGGDGIGWYTCLEDLTHSLTKPCIIDLKVGCRQYGDEASDAKRERLIKKCHNSTSVPLGFRICGMQVHRPAEVYRMDKFEGRKITPDTVSNAIMQFFLSSSSELRVAIVESVLIKLKELLTFLESSKKYRFYSASILFVYDAAAPDTQNVEVKLIDFAHSYLDSAEPDLGVIRGATSLVHILSSLLSSKDSSITRSKNKLTLIKPPRPLAVCPTGLIAVPGY
eukprot:TRINITY_DN5403_c0_g1_i1.p1 TRINITY_DN5403_c0_g1~~TRINITY_DN5403_c0_g1_i1.p1  ORF type:complete len:368 (-),score=39.38 TRINITY_DN5403_c0_g1_i1:48-1151(-)